MSAKIRLPIGVVAIYSQEVWTSNDKRLAEILNNLTFLFLRSGEYIPDPDVAVPKHIASIVGAKLLRENKIQKADRVEGRIY